MVACLLLNSRLFTFFDIFFSGELPPYFMARAHRLSGYDSDEEEDEFEELQEKIANNEDMVRIFYLFVSVQ